MDYDQVYDSTPAAMGGIAIYKGMKENQYLDAALKNKQRKEGAEADLMETQVRETARAINDRDAVEAANQKVFTAQQEQQQNTDQSQQQLPSQQTQSAPVAQDQQPSELTQKSPAQSFTERLQASQSNIAPAPKTLGVPGQTPTSTPQQTDIKGLPTSSIAPAPKQLQVPLSPQQAKEQAAQPQIQPAQGSAIAPAPRKLDVIDQYLQAPDHRHGENDALGGSMDKIPRDELLYNVPTMENRRTIIVEALKNGASWSAIEKLKAGWEDSDHKNRIGFYTAMETSIEQIKKVYYSTPDDPEVGHRAAQKIYKQNLGRAIAEANAQGTELNLPKDVVEAVETGYLDAMYNSIVPAKDREIAASKRIAALAAEKRADNQETIAKAKNETESRKVEETERHNRVMENIKKKEAEAKAAKDAGEESLSPLANEMFATYTKEGLPVPAMRNKKTAATYNAIAEDWDRNGRYSPSARKAGLVADTQSLKKIQTNTDAYEAFARTADTNAEALLDIAKSLPEIPVKFANEPMREILRQRGKLGEFDAYIRSLQSEYANLTQGTLGAVHVGVQEEMRHIFDPNLTYNGLQNALKALKKESQVRISSNKVQEDRILARLSGRASSGKKGGNPASQQDKAIFGETTSEPKVTGLDDPAYKALKSGDIFITPSGLRKVKP